MKKKIVDQRLASRLASLARRCATLAPRASFPSRALTLRSLPEPRVPGRTANVRSAPAAEATLDRRSAGLSRSTGGRTDGAAASLTGASVLWWGSSV